MIIVDNIPIKTIPGFPDYAVTKDGRVWSKPRRDARNQRHGGKWLSWIKADSTGHYRVCLFRNGKPHRIFVHRLVLAAYIGPCPPGMECRHLDGNPGNNNVSNLCWGTGKENQRDRINHGTDCRGNTHGKSKLTEEQVRVIFHAYHDGYYTQRDIAKAFGISQGNVKSITKKQTWKHLWS